MWIVQFKPNNANQAWSTFGRYGSETSGLHNASRIAGRYFMVRVVGPDGRVVWSG